MLDDDASPPSSQDLANDDFLFHLYRGSELLLDNRVHEAKQELEQALGVQPRDAKGQDLLAIVYFRLGLYPRAIAIYEALVAAHPEATSPRLNLALCYLKTGQPQSARAELERVLDKNPEHTRAWGYLGLAYQRLGDTERAVYAFRMGGHEGMARRLQALQAPEGARPDAHETAMRAAAAEVFEELDRRGVDFAPDAQGPHASSGSWAALEPGRERASVVPPRLSFAPAPARPGSLPPPGFSDLADPSDTRGLALPAVGAEPLRPSPVPREVLREAGEASASAAPPARGTERLSSRPPSAPEVDQADSSSDAERITVVVSLDDPAQAKLTRPAPPSADRAASPRPDTRADALSERLDGKPARIGEPASTTTAPAAIHDPLRLARARQLILPKRLTAGHAAPGLVVIRGGGPVAARIEAVRAMRAIAGHDSAPLPRRGRATTSEGPLGGVGSPLVSLDGATDLVLAAPPGLELLVLQLSTAAVYFRESALVALEGEFAWENARMPQGDAEPAHVVALTGTGSATLALPEGMRSLEVLPPEGLTLRARSLLGWTSGLSVRAVPQSEAPARARGLCYVDGQGMVFLDGR